MHIYNIVKNHHCNNFVALLYEFCYDIYLTHFLHADVLLFCDSGAYPELGGGGIWIMTFFDPTPMDIHLM